MLIKRNGDDQRKEVYELGRGQERERDRCVPEDRFLNLFYKINLNKTNKSNSHHKAGGAGTFDTAASLSL